MSNNKSKAIITKETEKLNEMTVVNLRAYCKEQSIKIPSGSVKADIISIIIDNTSKLSFKDKQIVSSKSLNQDEGEEENEEDEKATKYAETSRHSQI